MGEAPGFLIQHSVCKDRTEVPTYQTVLDASAINSVAYALIRLRAEAVLLAAAQPHVSVC
jgi:hypothetical protein